MKNFAILAFAAFGAIGNASATNWEYEYEDYTVREDFMAIAAARGAQGWELATCMTSTSVPYNVYGEVNLYNLQLARTSYCIFKREIGSSKK